MKESRWMVSTQVPTYLGSYVGWLKLEIIA